jgi:UDP-N-acetylglucosamine acyltransferase
MISKNSSIHKLAKIGKGVEIGDYCVIGKSVEIGDYCKIYNSVIISGNTKIGKKNTFYPFCTIGSNPQDLKFKGEESFLEIGNNNIFREYCNISLGTENGGYKTIIGNNSLYMIGSHVGHDCKMGDQLIIANNAAIAGHCEFENEVILGGNSAVLQFSKIGQGAMIGGMTGVDRDVLPYTLVKGNRSFYENLNLIGLKRKGFKNKEIEDYKKTINNLFDCENMSEYLSELNLTFNLNSILFNFIKNKNPSRDICRPIK